MKFDATLPSLGIIPARAGFTSAGRFRGDAEPDHPRSRGVYSPSSSKKPWGTGSSPLARGLLPVPVGEQGVGGIIPARAGFTHDAVPDGLDPRDHPRSRGVYHPAPPHVRRPEGSSPLARGLHPLIGQGGSHIRIIPARAGFTGRRAAIRRRPGDHPRSRGVYGFQAFALVVLVGSSPLARGLPSKLPGPPMVGGIIPARAGFTERR